MFEASQWFDLLTACRVDTATAATWAPVCARTIRPHTFSAGPRDLLDFLPTITHESAGLRRLVENMNYSAERIRELGATYGPNSRWGRAARQAADLANNPEALAEVVYGGRLGNDQPGDGWRYIGRSPIHITGKDGYRYVGELTGQDYVGIPHLLAQPHFALEACIAWWEGRIPDNLLGDVPAVRRRVQGGTLGLEDVQRRRDSLAPVLDAAIGADL